MSHVLTLMRPRILSFQNKRNQGNQKAMILLYFVLGGGFWTALLWASYRVISYFAQLVDIGDIIAFKLLSMILLTFFCLLIFSSILTILTKLFLSKDLILVHALPIPIETLFLSRWIESTVDSSWMVLVYSLPVLLSYGIAYHAGLFYYLCMFVSIIPLCIIASGVSALLIMVIVIILPASRIRNIVMLVGLLFFIAIYIAFRMLQPERLVAPETFASIVIYLKQLHMPLSPILPSTWCFDALKNALNGQIGVTLFHLSLSLSCACFLIFLNLWIAQHIYFSGYSKTQAAIGRLIMTQKDRLLQVLSFLPLPGPVKAFTFKEIKTFFRDQSQWSQLFLLGALVVIYIYNFSVLPLNQSPIQSVYLQNLFSFLNLALAAFVLTAVSARFAFPSISMEGSSFWIVQSAPISIRSFLLIKYIIYLIPLLCLSEILIIITNIFLHVSTFMMILSICTITLITPGIISLGVGLGAAYPDFSSENPAQSVTSFGGVMFMILSATFIGVCILLESGPVYAYLMAQIHHGHFTTFHYQWMIFSFSVVFILSIATIILPLYFGEKKLLARL